MKYYAIVAGVGIIIIIINALVFKDATRRDSDEWMGHNKFHNIVLGFDNLLYCLTLSAYN